MEKQTVLLALLAVCPFVAPAQGQSRLLYTPLNEATSNQSAVYPALTQVRPNEVQFVGPSQMSRAYATVPNYNTLIGDHDNDDLYNEPDMFQRIDALLPPYDPNGTPIPTTMRQLFFSTKEVVNHCPNGWAPPLRPGDVARIVTCPVDGTLERFIRVEHLQIAFGMFGQVPDVDAIAYDPRPVYGGIFLSFESTHDILTLSYAGPVRDGAILRIPNEAITWAFSCYDGARLVANVRTEQGEVVLFEGDVDSLVQNATVFDCSGVQVMNVRDTNGLEIHPDGGLFHAWNGTLVRNLWFCGTGLERATVVTTAGVKAQLNGVDLDSLGVVGLVDPCRTSLDGLTLQENVGRLTTDTATGSVTGGSFATVEVGGALPATWMLWSFATGACAVDPTVPFANWCFPELYPSFVLVNPVTVDADHCGSDTMFLPRLAFSYRAIAQAVAWDGTVRLGTPTVIDVRPR